MAGFRLLLSVTGAWGDGELQVDDNRVWVWSDLHLGDVDALDFFGRPFGSVDEMDDVILEHWLAGPGRSR